MQDRTLLATGIVGSAIAAICCFTPALVILFALAGVSAWLAFADYVLFPILFLFLGITAYARLLRHRHKKAAC